MKSFYHIWAWRPSWSCDLNYLYKQWSPLPIDASYKIQGVSEKQMFEYYGYIHVFCSGVGADGPLVSISFQNH